MRAAWQLAMADGDLVRVYSIVPLYRKTVILRGNTANPGRFAWHPGMHISDLIPDKESLITRNYWWKRAQLDCRLRKIAGRNAQPEMQRRAQSRIETIHERANQRIDQQHFPGSRADSTATRVPAPAQRTEVRALAPEIDWNYAVIERLDPETLKSIVIPFDLGKLVLQHDASQDLELQAGDVVSIFSEADIRVPIAQQTKLVTLDGEFVHAGVYTVQPGETLRHLVERAGGLTPNAYLYGSEFTRESTRAMQQARIDEYVQSLSMQIQRSSLAMAASAGQFGAGYDQCRRGAEQRTERFLPACGRFAPRGASSCDLRRTAAVSNSLPDIAMEDGDRFVVPPIPATVNVVGAVYDQNSFLYARGRRAGDLPAAGRRRQPGCRPRA